MIPENIVLCEDIEKCLRLFFENKNYSAIAVLVDENTLEHCYPLIESKLPPHSVHCVQSGEVNKNIQTCTAIWSWMTKLSLDRHALIINLGGGVLGDMGGFCASTYKRGIDFVNIPTTLLSQVDASIGGKLGIDFEQNKNHIGLFNEPKQVIINPIFLKTLAERELKSGYAEVIKHVLIADKKKWDLIKNFTLTKESIAQLIPDSIAIKAKVIQEDPFEKGLRKILNFGHTIGHAIESEYLEQGISLLHGEAIAIGMICEGYLSTLKAGLKHFELIEIIDLISKHYDYKKINEDFIPRIKKRAIQDKKNVSGKIKCVLLTEIGSAIYDQEIDTNDIEEAIKFYSDLSLKN